MPRTDDCLPAFEDPPAAPAWRRWAGRVAGFLGGGLVGVAAAASADRLLDGLSGLALAGLLGGLVLGVWFHIVLHEAGHALAGLAAGMRPLALGVGRWRFERGASGAWRRRRADAIAGLGGFAIMLPRTGRGRSRPAQAVYLLGGPLANLLTALAAWLVATRLSQPVAAAALSGFGVGALFLGLANLVPFRTHGWLSDGMGLWQLLRGAYDALLGQRLQAAAGLALSGVRPRDWPPDLLPDEPALEGASPLLATQGRMLRLAHAVDRDDRDAAWSAARALATGARAVPATFRAHVAVSMAGFAESMTDDATLLAAWRPWCEGGLLDLSPYRHWLDAELAARRGEADAAVQALARARAARDRVHDRAGLLLFDEALARADRRLARMPTA